MRAIELPRGIILTEQIGGAEVLEHSIRDRIREGWTGIIRGRQNRGDSRVEGHVSLLKGGPVLAHCSEGDLRGMDALDALRELFEDPLTRVTFHAEIDIEALVDIWPEARLERLGLKLEDADVDQAVAREADADMRLGWWRRLTEQTVARDVPSLPEARPNARLRFPDRIGGSVPHGITNLRWGAACMVEGSIDDLVQVGRAANQTERELLMITRRPLNQVPSELLHGTKLRLTEREGDLNSTSPRPDRIRDTIHKWLNSHQSGVVLLDGLEYSAGIHGSAQMLEALDGIVDRIRFEEHIFIATIDLNSWNQRDQHRLRATMDALHLRDLQGIRSVFEEQTSTSEIIAMNNPITTERTPQEEASRTDPPEPVPDEQISIQPKVNDTAPVEQQRVDPALMAGFLEDITDGEEGLESVIEETELSAEVPVPIFQPSINRTSTKQMKEMNIASKEEDNEDKKITSTSVAETSERSTLPNPLAWEPSVIDHWSKVPAPPERIEQTREDVREAAHEEFTLRLNKEKITEDISPVKIQNKGPRRPTTNHGAKRRRGSLPATSNAPSPPTRAAVSTAKDQEELEVLGAKHVSHGAAIPEAPTPLTILPTKNEAHGAVLPEAPTPLEDHPALKGKIPAIGMKRSTPQEFTGGPEAKVLPGRTQWDKAASRARTATVLDANPRAPPPKERGKAIGLGRLRKEKEVHLEKKKVEQVLDADPAILPPKSMDRNIGLKPMPKTIGVHIKRKDTGDTVLDAAPEAPAPRVVETSVGLSPMQEKKGFHLKKKKKADTFRDDIEKEIEI